ncbi:MAG: (d)CMP kinase [Candidatus Promineifilaceae bacterium]
MTANDPPQVIAIDGPAASGKTTVGRLLAETLGFLLLDTGSMYRAVTLAALQQQVDINEEAAVVALARKVVIEILPAFPHQDGRLCTVLLDGLDVTWALRTADVDAHVSQVAAYKEVREELVRQQRRLAAKGKVVMVGRDIGTVVVPDAALKLFVTASIEERARRRWLERHERNSQESYAAVLADMKRRDEIDSNRQYSPLRAADDAITLDTTTQSPETVVQEILGLCYDMRCTAAE